MNTHLLLGFSATALVSFAAHGAMITGATYKTTHDGSVEVEFVSQDAGAKGSLYFLGSVTGGTTTYAPSSDSNNLGQFLFQNHGTSAGYTVYLGIFDAETTLYFAYKITHGVSVAPTGTIFRMDAPGDLLYFGQEVVLNTSEGSATRVWLEDIKNPSKSDWDYNDLAFDVNNSYVAPAPAPGAWALAIVGILIGTRRYRPPARRA